MDIWIVPLVCCYKQRSYKHLCVYLLACMFKSFLQIMSMELESVKGGVCAGNAKSLPQGLCQLTLPLAVDENSHCSASTLVLDIICILNFCHFDKYEMVSCWGFNLYSLLLMRLHIFSHVLGAIWTSSVVQLLYFFCWVFTFYLFL